METQTSKTDSAQIDLTPIYIDPTVTVRVRIKGAVSGTPEDAYILVRGITVLGTHYASVQDAANSLNASLENAIKRLRDLYYDEWKANNSILATPPPEQIDRAFLPGHIVVNGQAFHNVSLAAEHHKVPAGFALQRLKKLPKDATEDAINRIFDRAEYKSSRRKRRTYVKGIWYNTLAQACKVHGVDNQTAARKIGELKNPTQNEIDAIFAPSDTHTRNPESITVAG